MLGSNRSGLGYSMSTWLLVLLIVAGCATSPRVATPVTHWRIEMKELTPLERHELLFHSGCKQTEIFFDEIYFKCHSDFSPHPKATFVFLSSKTP